LLHLAGMLKSGRYAGNCSSAVDREVMAHRQTACYRHSPDLAQACLRREVAAKKIWKYLDVLFSSAQHALFRQVCTFYS
jgi:hypothetical protein